MRRNGFAALRKSDAFGVHAHADIFAVQNFEDGRGDIFVLAMHQSRAHFENGHAGAKTPEHLAELQADVAAAHDDQVLRQIVHLHHGTVSEIGDPIESRHRRDYRAFAYVDENSGGGEAVRPDGDLPRRFKARVAFVHGAILHVFQPGFDGRARLSGDGILASFHAPHIDLRAGRRIHAELRGARDHAGRVGARDHGFGRNAAGVDAGASEQLALHDGDPHSGFCEAAGERGPGLSGSDDDGVEGSGHGILLINCGRARFVGVKPCPPPDRWALRKRALPRWRRPEVDAGKVPGNRHNP